MMENLNAQVCSLYGEYRDVSSMMVLMTAHQPQGDGDNMMTKRVPLENSNSSFHDLISGAAIFYSNNLQRQYRLEMAARPVSSAPLVKMGGCHNFTNGLEFHSEEAVNCFGELSSMQSGSQLITSLAPHADSPNFSSNSRITTDEEEMDVMKAKILGHPQYRCLLEAYVHCIKVGVPPEIVARLDAAAERYENGHNETIVSIGMDPELDMFMETYCEMLSTFKEKLAKPVKEAMSFFKKIETQLNSLNNGTIDITPSAESDEKTEGGGSVDEEDCSTGETDYQWAGLHSEEQELKDLLRRKYSGYLGSLKQEFMKKKKRGKLPKEARQKLLDWWNLHQKWPYPSETEKMALAEWTRLDQKQINNWFINQRKRHWKPDPEDTEFVLVDSHGTHTADFFVERHLMAEGSSFHLD